MKRAAALGDADSGTSAEPTCAKPECRGQVSAVVAEMVAEADSIDDLDREALVL